MHLSGIVRLGGLFLFILVFCLPGLECKGQAIKTRELFRDKAVTLTLEISSKKKNGRMINDTTLLLAGPNARTKTTTSIKAFEGSPKQMRELILEMEHFTHVHKKEQNIQQRYHGYTLIIKNKKKYLLLQNMWGDAIGFKFSTISQISKHVDKAFIGKHK